MLKLAGLFLSLGFVLGLIGCASAGPKNIGESLLEQNQAPLVMNKVDFMYYKEGDRQCGPASLGMMIRQHQPNIDLETLHKMTFSPHADGSFKPDMISAARRLGFATYPVTSVEKMFEFSARAYPVLVFQNLGLSWAPQWHYAVLVGYDQPTNEVFIHTGEYAYKRMRFKRFKHSWMRGGKWSYIITRPEDLPREASYEEALENAVVLERLNRREQALKLYEQMSLRWTDRYETDVGLANMYAPDDKAKAIEFLLKALKKENSNPGVYYNLAYLYHSENKPELARQMGERALTVAKPEQLAFYRAKVEELFAQALN